ncbi:MAG: endonuclease/exonuclease/phosphatase family protein [Calditrichota bacterium]
MVNRLFYTALFGFLLIFAGCEKQTPVTPPETLTTEEQIPASEAEGFAKWQFCQGSIRVMTRNVYVGTDLDSIYRVQDPNLIPEAVTWAVQMMLSTNFPERAQAIAKEVALGQPHLIGLQEISLFRIQSPGDAVFGGTVPAEEIWFDYLDILLNALQEKGLDYRVAGIIENFDVEVPMVAGINPLSFDDVRLTDYDVVLVRNDVVVENVETQNYQEFLSVPQFNLAVKRGYVALDATVGGKTYRFVSTHLESEGEPIRYAQAEELVATFQNETRPVILVGDLNTRAPGEPTYQYLLSQDFVDTWTRSLVPFNRDGYTAIHDPDLRNTTVKLDHRIDLVLVRSNKWRFNRQLIGPVLAFVVGDELRDRTPSGLWPSDHAGVIARLQIPTEHN